MGAQGKVTPSGLGPWDFAVTHDYCGHELQEHGCPRVTRFQLDTHSLVEVNEPDGELGRGRLVPVDGVALLQSDNRLVLLVVGAPGQGPLQVERTTGEVILDDLHP